MRRFPPALVTDTPRIRAMVDDPLNRDPDGSLAVGPITCAAVLADPAGAPVYLDSKLVVLALAERHPE